MDSGQAHGIVDRGLNHVVYPLFRKSEMQWRKYARSSVSVDAATLTEIG
jgi:hypothetical protein